MYSDRQTPGPDDPSLLTRQSEHRSEAIYAGQELPDLTGRASGSHYWDVVRGSAPPDVILRGITAAGFFGVYQIGRFRRDRGLITALVERWRPETHTFHFRFGEASISLEDAYYLLGLHSNGDPLVYTFPALSTPQRRTFIEECLGVVPVGSDMNSVGGIKLQWLVDQFADCHRLDPRTADYELQVTHHLRGHLLLIIGSLFPDQSGNRLTYEWLYYLRELSRVSSYSWGGAVVAYLYYSLNKASRAGQHHITGSMPLLQVWAYERFPHLAPRPVTEVPIRFPFAQRWTIPMEGRSVPTHKSKMIRYQLDFMRSDSGFWWRPYRYVPEEDRPSMWESRLWTARCLLFCNDHIMYYYPDRFTRQFGMIQGIPPAPHPRHFWYQDLHGCIQDHVLVLQPMIDDWHTRSTRVLVLRVCKDGKRNCTSSYETWFDSITRHFIGNPAAIIDGYGWTGVHDLQLRSAPGSSRRHVPTGRPRGRPYTTAVPLQPGEYYTSVGQDQDHEEHQEDHEEHQEDQQGQFSQDQFSQGGFSGGHQQGQFSQGGFSGGHQQEQFSQGQSSLGGFTGGHQQEQFSHEQFSQGQWQTPPPYTQESSGQQQGWDHLLTPRSYFQTQDTWPQEMGHQQGKDLGHRSHTPFAGFVGWADMSSPFLTPPRATQTQTQTEAEDEDEDEEVPLRRRAPHRAARVRGRGCGTGGHLGGDH